MMDSMTRRLRKITIDAVNYTRSLTTHRGLVEAVVQANHQSCNCSNPHVSHVLVVLLIVTLRMFPILSIYNNNVTCVVESGSSPRSRVRKLTGSPHPTSFQSSPKGICSPKEANGPSSASTSELMTLVRYLHQKGHRVMVC